MMNFTKKYLITLVVVIVLVFMVRVKVLGRPDDDKQVSVSNSGNTLTPSRSVASGTSTQSSPSSSPTSSMMMGKYKDGIYTGQSADAYYGNIQIKVTISGGKISDIVFLDHPQDSGNSRSINNQAMPMLKSEAILAQSAQVDGVSGASASSQAFVNSLQSALDQAV